MLLALVVVGLGIAIGLLAVSALVPVGERPAKQALRQIEQYGAQPIREQELAAPLWNRSVVPILSAFARLGHRYTPSGYVDASRKKLALSGRSGQTSLDHFLALRVTLILLIPVYAVVCVFLPTSGVIQLSIFLFLAFASVLGPDAILNRQIEARKHLIRIRLPDTLDLLTISVEAGLGFDQALERTVTNVPGPLSDEFQRLLREVQAGATRSDALASLDDRTDVAELRSFTLAIRQADTFGISIGRLLRAQADEMRVKRRQMIQEEAQKAPVKMLFPMVFCIMPSLFVIVVGPAVINILKNFK